MSMRKICFLDIAGINLIPQYKTIVTAGIQKFKCLKNSQIKNVCIQYIECLHFVNTIYSIFP